MARRANAPQTEPIRVEADGDYILLRRSARFDEVVQMREQAKDNSQAMFATLALFAVEWSFADESGVMLPITTENVADNADAVVIVAAIGELVKLPFLAQMSRLANRV